MYNVKYWIQHAIAYVCPRPIAGGDPDLLLLLMSVFGRALAWMTLEIRVLMYHDVFVWIVKIVIYMNIPIKIMSTNLVNIFYLFSSSVPTALWLFELNLCNFWLERFELVLNDTPWLLNLGTAVDDRIGGWRISVFLNEMGSLWIEM